MVSPRDAMEAVARAVANSGKLPADLSVLLHEADQANDDADVDLPLLEIQPITVENIDIENTDLVGFTVDNDGNQTGRIYFSEYEMGIQLDLWTTKDDGYDPDNLGRLLREALYQYSSYGPADDFTDESGDPIKAITYFTLGDGERDDGLFDTPTVRRWSQDVELWASEEFRTEDDHIVSVDYPEDGELNDSNEDGTVENT